MAHNFKIVNGDKYISKAGHDSNDGLTPDTPKRSINSFSVLGGRTIIGSGHYKGGSVQGVYETLNIKGDGKVILDSINFGKNTYFSGSSGDEPINIEFRNCRINAKACTPSKIIAKDCRIHGVVSNVAYDECVFINTKLFMSDDVFKNIYSSIIIRGYGDLGNLTNCYVDKNSQFNSIYSEPSLTNCNFRGVINFKLTNNDVASFAIQDQMTGTPEDNGYSSNVHWLNEDNLIDLGCIGDVEGWDERLLTCTNREPLFNDAINYDFTLQAGSPHIGMATDGFNVGGTDLAYTVLNVNANKNNLEIVTSVGIDTTDKTAFTLKPGFSEGYIDYIQKIGSSPLTLGVISPISATNFNSDFEGGGLENNNVPDSGTLSNNNPRKFTATSNSTDIRKIEISGHDIKLGEFIKVNGQYGEVVSTTHTNITVSAPLRALINTGAIVQVGTKHDLGSLNPNRLTYLLRTSKKTTKPDLLTDWDNDINPPYNMSGRFLLQEWDSTPGYFIDYNDNSVYGAGDYTSPTGLVLNEISCLWINLRVYIRNNYIS